MTDIPKLMGIKGNNVRFTKAEPNPQNQNPGFKPLPPRIQDSKYRYAKGASSPINKALNSKLT